MDFFESTASAPKKGTPSGDRYWALLKGQQGVHKGEAEAFTWQLERPLEDRLEFITNDKQAKRAAEKLSIPTGDLMTFVVRMVESKAIPRSVACDKLAVWDSDRRSRCCPADYEGFDATFARRQQAP